MIHSKSNDIEIMINNKADGVIEELFHSFLSKYQIGLETSMKGSDFFFDCVHLLYCKCHNISPNQGLPYIDSLEWIKNKKATIVPSIKMIMFPICCNNHIKS